MSDSSLIIPVPCQLVRAFNRRLPSARLRYSLAKRCQARLRSSPGVSHVVEGFPHGLRYALDFTSKFERMIYLHARDVRVVECLEKILRPGDLYIDVGANIGHLATIAAKCVGPQGAVLAFEPHPETFNRLRCNAELNQLDWLRLYPSGCAAERGVATLRIYADDSPDTATLAADLARPVREEVAVDLIPLDEVWRELGRPAPRLLKVDAEGFETEVFRGARELVESQPEMVILAEINGASAQALGHNPTGWVEELFVLRSYAMTLVRSRRVSRVTLEELIREVEAHPKRAHNVLLTPDVERG